MKGLDRPDYISNVFVMLYLCNFLIVEGQFAISFFAKTHKFSFHPIYNHLIVGAECFEAI